MAATGRRRTEEEKPLAVAKMAAESRVFVSVGVTWRHVRETLMGLHMNESSTNAPAEVTHPPRQGKSQVLASFYPRTLY